MTQHHDSRFILGSNRGLMAMYDMSTLDLLHEEKRSEARDSISERSESR